MSKASAVQINGFAVTGDTVAARWAHFRELIEPELASKRLKPPADEEPGNLLNPQRKGWKPPKVRRYHGKRSGYHWSNKGHAKKGKNYAK